MWFPLIIGDHLVINLYRKHKLGEVRYMETTILIFLDVGMTNFSMKRKTTRKHHGRKHMLKVVKLQFFTTLERFKLTVNNVGNYK